MRPIAVKHQRQAFLTIGLFLLMATGIAGARGERVGQFLEATEGVRIRREERNLRAFLLTAVRDGDVIRVPVGQRAEVVLDGTLRRLALLGGSVCRAETDRIVTLNGDAAREKRRLARQYRLPQFGRGFAGGISRSVDFPADAPPEPVGAVRAEPVQLSWKGLPGQAIEGDEVELEIRQGEGEAAAGGPLAFRRRLPAAQRETTVPEGKLVPGRPYVWMVRRVEDGAPATRLFVIPLRVLLPEEVEALKELESAPRESVADRLALAVAYERLQLIGDALRAMREAAKQTPGNPELERHIRRLERTRLGLAPLAADRDEDAAPK